MARFDTHTYELPSGATVEFESLPSHGRGKSDVSSKRESRLALSEVVKPLGEVADLLFKSIKSATREPDSVSLELSASIKGQSSLVIVSGETQGSIKVVLKWGKG